MMISPEIFYKMKLEGKSIKEIQASIRRLKRQINQLKCDIQSQDRIVLGLYPSLKTRLYYNRLYLAQAKEALIEAGGEYQPSRREEKAQVFDENLPFIEKITLFYRFYEYGSEYREISFSGDTVILDYKSCEGRLGDETWVKEYPSMKQKFLEALANLHLGEWQTCYDPFKVRDGSKWELLIYFSNGHREVRKQGYDAFPYNFNDFYRLIELENNDRFKPRSTDI